MKGAPRNLQQGRRPHTTQYRTRFSGIMVWQGVKGVPVRKLQIRKFARKKVVFLIQIRIGLPNIFFTYVRIFRLRNAM
jgi:hypothetical protein